jgi:glycerophosphoryl diester phosphodiesterase
MVKSVEKRYISAKTGGQMKKVKKILKRLIIILLILGVFMFLNNTSLLTKERNDKPLLLAHRGMAQTFHMEGITGETCTAERIYEPEHSFLENTIPSMEAAFEAGADELNWIFSLQRMDSLRCSMIGRWNAGQMQREIPEIIQ